MAKQTKPNPVLAILKKSTPTGGGPRTTMPVTEWLTELREDGAFMVPTFHGLKGDNAGYRSGEIHTQLRRVLKGYYWTYRTPAKSEQVHLFVSRTMEIFIEAEIPDEQVSHWSGK